MAFTAAGGWTNLPSGNFTPVIYSKKVLKYFRKASVVEDITNTDYSGEIANEGDTVQIIKEPVLTVSSYVRGQQTVSQPIADDKITMVIDKANYFQFEVDDIEKKQSHISWEPLATSSAAYALKDAYDTEVLNYIAGQALAANIYGTTGAPIDVGFGTSEVDPLNVLSRLGRFLDEQNVPFENRWFVAPPTFWEEAQNTASKLIDLTITGDASSLLRNGRVTNGLIRGFKCYQSNNLPSGSGYKVALAGHMSSTATASQIAQTEVLRSQTSFGDIVRGLHLYGRKTLRPESTALCYFAID